MDLLGGRTQGDSMECDCLGYCPPRCLCRCRSVVPSIRESVSSAHRSVAITAWIVPALASDPVDAKGERRRAIPASTGMTSPLHCQGATSCFLDKLSDGICCKSPDVNELENPQITQIFADSRGRGEGENKKEGGLTLAVVSSISLLPFL
jgi:hypothetical protein